MEASVNNFVQQLVEGDKHWFAAPSRIAISGPRRKSTLERRTGDFSSSGSSLSHATKTEGAIFLPTTKELLRKALNKASLDGLVRPGVPTHMKN